MDYTYFPNAFLAIFHTKLALLDSNPLLPIRAYCSKDNYGTDITLHRLRKYVPCTYSYYSILTIMKNVSNENYRS